MAQSILEHVLAEAGKTNARRVLELQVDTGELMQVDAEALSKALKLLATGAMFDDCRIQVQVQSARFRCEKCDSSWDMMEARKQLEPQGVLRVEGADREESHLHLPPSIYLQFLHCPNCGGSDVSAAEGDGVWVRKLVME